MHEIFSRKQSSRTV